MEQLKNAFYEVMYKYQKAFSEEGVMENLRSWASGKAELMALLRRHPDWNEDAKAVVIPFKEGRGIEQDVIDEISFMMLEIADEQIDAERINAFRVAFGVAVGEYSQTLSDNALTAIRENAQIKCATGEKTSRIIGKICRKFGLDSHARYNTVFASLSDALNPIQIARTAVLSVHPCDYLEMSNKDNSWTSCHGLDGGGYQGGTLSYLTDDVSLIFFTVDPEVTECFYRAPRRTRQMFFFKDNCLYQSRLYPASADEVTEQNRGIVHKILATCLGVPNLWILKTKRDEINCCLSAAGSTHYPDYNRYGNLSFIKGTPTVPKMTIGNRPICVCCGEEFSDHHALKCGCPELVVCQDCGQTLPRQQTRYLEGAFHCNACLHICGSCGNICRETMYPAYDRRGRLIEVCQQCYNASQEPCFACSVRNVCAIIGNMFCHQATLRPVQQQEVT